MFAADRENHISPASAALLLIKYASGPALELAIKGLAELHQQRAGALGRVHSISYLILQTSRLNESHLIICFPSSRVGCTLTKAKYQLRN